MSTRLAALTLLSMTLGAASGCEAIRYRSAAKHDSVAAYLQYLSHHPKGRHAAAARERVARLQYWDARRADRPVGYRTYLLQHPDGAHAGACRARLARLALTRARTAADLELVLERYPDSAEATEAEKRLPALLAREALRARDPAVAVQFLDRFPQSSEVPRVRAHLASLRYRHVAPRQADLEAFIQEFSGTPQGKQAMAKLEQLLRQRVAEGLDPRDLAQFRARFPLSPRLGGLEQLVEQERLRRAVALLDLAALAGMDNDEAGFLVRWCKQNAGRCDGLRSLAHSARPWTPAESLQKLRARSYAADPQQAWEAMVRLSFTRAPAAGDLLLELLGSVRLGAVWPAASALDRWVGRLSSNERRRWLESRLARAHHPANDDEAQRRAHLDLLDGKEAGLIELRRLVSRPSRMLVAGFLLSRWEQKLGDGRPPSREALQRMSAAARARVVWLRDAFPAELHRDSLFAAVLVERELFALLQAIEAIRTSAGHAALEDVRRESEALLAGWRRRLADEGKGAFAPARWPDVGETVSRHEQGRAAALERLARSGTAARLVAGAVCGGRDRPAEVCGRLQLQSGGAGGRRRQMPRQPSRQ